MELAFEFYDKDNQLIKTESIMILASRSPIDLPKLTIDVSPSGDLNAATNASININIETRPDFKILDGLRVSFNTHLGWEVGPQASIPLKDQLNNKTIHAETSFPIPDNCWIVNASAGVPIQYGKFIFKIHDQKIIFRGDWAKEIGRN